MSEKASQSQPIHVINEDRVVSFSDAVFAFAITLLVLKLDLPSVSRELAPTQLFDALVDLWPQYVSNIISFVIIGNYWILHHRLLNLVKRFDMPFIWLNLFLLMGISFIPFPTDLLGEYGNTQVAVAFYYLTLTAVGIIQFATWFYASYKHKLVSKDLSKAHINLYTIRSIIPPVVFAYSVLLSFFDLTLAMYSWMLVLLIVPLFSHYWKDKHGLSNY